MKYGRLGVAIVSHLGKTLSHGRPRSVSGYLWERSLIQFDGEEARNNKSAGIRSLARRLRAYRKLKIITRLRYILLSESCQCTYLNCLCFAGDAIVPSFREERSVEGAGREKKILIAIIFSLLGARLFRNRGIIDRKNLHGDKRGINYSQIIISFPDRLSGKSSG